MLLLRFVPFECPAIRSAGARRKAFRQRRAEDRRLPLLASCRDRCGPSMPHPSLSPTFLLVGQLDGRNGITPRQGRQSCRGTFCLPQEDGRDFRGDEGRPASRSSGRLGWKPPDDRRENYRNASNNRALQPYLLGTNAPNISKLQVIPRFLRHSYCANLARNQQGKNVYFSQLRRTLTERWTLAKDVQR